jgi:UDP-N-acetylmuramate dehydrogenase
VDALAMRLEGELAAAAAEDGLLVAGGGAANAVWPTNKRTFGSVFKNPEHELSAGRMLEACGLRGHRIGGAQISPRHANFIENAGEARAAEALALMAEARRRALEEFGTELEHEVRLLGGLELPPAGETL